MKRQTRYHDRRAGVRRAWCHPPVTLSQAPNSGRTQLTGKGAEEGPAERAEVQKPPTAAERTNLHGHPNVKTGLE